MYTHFVIIPHPLTPPIGWFKLTSHLGGSLQLRCLVTQVTVTVVAPRFKQERLNDLEAIIK